MKSGSPQPLVIELYEKRDRKGAFKDDNLLATCSFPSSLTTNAAFSRVKEFAQQWDKAAAVENPRMRVVKALVEMGAVVGTRYKSVTVLKKIVPDYVRAFPTGVPIEGGTAATGGIEVSDQGMARSLVGIDGVVRIDLKAGHVSFGGVERLGKVADAARLYPELEVLEGDEGMLEFPLAEAEAVRTRWFSGRRGQTCFAIGDAIWTPIE